MEFVVSQEVRAVEADAAQHLDDVVQHVAVVHWLLQFDVAEMPRAVDLRAHAGLAETIAVHGAEQVVVDAVLHGVSVVLVGAVFVDVVD